MTWKRWAWRTAGAVVVLLVTRTAWLVGQREWRRSAGEKEYAAAVAETERSDPDWRWDDLNAKRPRPAAGKNSADVIARLGELVPRGRGAKLHSDAWQPYVSLPPNVDYSNEVALEVLIDLDRAHAAVVLCRTLKDYPDPGHRELVLSPDVVGTRLDDTQRTREAIDLLWWDAVQSLDAGKPDRAADDLVAALNASRSVGDEPFLISQLVRMACRAVAVRSAERVLAHHTFDDATLARLQAVWAADADEPLLLYGLRGERAAYDELFRGLADGSIRPDVADSGVFVGSFGDFSRWLYRGRYPRERAAFHRHLTAAVGVARLPVHDQPAALAALPRVSDGEEAKLARLLMPAIEKRARSYWRCVAGARCVAVGLACERFRLKHGRWPAALAELPKDLLATVPLDPFDGQPLRFRRLADGVAVYSVGENRRDDEGDTRHAANSDGQDEGFRLWDPDHRRRPAPPGPPVDPDAPPDPEEP